jgi:Tfp pilus assembly protein PilN
MKKQGTMVIEVTDRYVRLACIQSGRLCHVDARSRDPREPLLKEIDIPKRFFSFEVILVIARREVIFKILDLPSGDADELRRMVDMQIASQVPFTKDEIEYGLDVLQTFEDGRSRVLVAVIEKEKAAWYFAAVQSRGLEVSRMIISSSALVNACLRSRPEIEDDRSCRAFVCVDEGHSELCFILGGKMLFSKHFAVGFGGVMETDDPALAREVVRAIQTFVRDYPGTDPEDVIVAAPLRCRERFIAQLRALSGREIEPAADLPLPVFDGADQQKWNAHFESASAFAVLGAAGPQETSAINLLPAVKVEQEIFKKKRAFRNRFLISLLFASVSLAALLNSRPVRQQLYLAKLNERYEQIRPMLKGAQEAADLMNMVKERSRPRVHVVSLLNELFKLTPEDIVYRSVQMDAAGTLTLQGEARSGASVSLLQKNLVASRMFQDEMLRYATKRKRINDEVTEFQIACRVKF